MDHRLGYPAVLRALFGAPAARALPVYATWPPICGTTEGDKASTAEHDAKNAPKPVKRDEPYRPDGFDFQYVDHKGHLSDTVIPKRPAPSTFKDREPESIITPLAPSAAVPTAIEVMEACRHLDNDTWERLIREFGMSPGQAYHDMPEANRAEFIRRCNAFRPESTQ